MEKIKNIIIKAKTFSHAVQGSLPPLNSSALPFSSPITLSDKRIGPHKYEVLCVLIGSLLGDAHMERDGKITINSNHIN